MGSRGGVPVGCLGTKSPEAEVVTSKFYAFFGSISHISPICLCFSVLAGIIPLSLRNGGGH